MVLNCLYALFYGKCLFLNVPKGRKNNFCVLRIKILKILYIWSMSNFLKIIVILFAGMLSYGSISRDLNEQLLSTSSMEAEGESSYSSIAELSLVKSFCLHQSLENLVNPLNHFPRPESKYNSPAYGPAASPVELKIRNAAIQYLSHSKRVSLGLVISDIIFPFHYFW